MEPPTKVSTVTKQHFFNKVGKPTDKTIKISIQGTCHTTTTKNNKLMPKKQIQNQLECASFNKNILKKIIKKL